jgi:hypothetical protein
VHFHLPWAFLLGDHPSHPLIVLKKIHETSCFQRIEVKSFSLIGTQAYSLVVSSGSSRRRRPNIQGTEKRHPKHNDKYLLRWVASLSAFGKADDVLRNIHRAINQNPYT